MLPWADDFGEFVSGLINFSFKDLCFQSWSKICWFCIVFLRRRVCLLSIEFCDYFLNVCFYMFPSRSETSWNHCPQSLLIWVYGREVLKCWACSTKIHDIKILDACRLKADPMVTLGSGFIYFKTRRISLAHQILVGYQKWWFLLRNIEKHVYSNLDVYPPKKRSYDRNPKTSQK